MDAIKDPMMRKALQDQVANYGQTPMQLFTTPHLKRNPRPTLARIVQWTQESLRFALFQMPVSSNSPIAYAAVNSSKGEISKVLTVSCDGSFAIHKWISKKVQDSTVPRSTSSLPFSLEIDPLLGNPDLESKRQIPLPFDEHVIPSQLTFEVTSDFKILISCGHWFSFFLFFFFFFFLFLLYNSQYLL